MYNGDYTQYTTIAGLYLKKPDFLQLLQHYIALGITIYTADI